MIQKKGYTIQLHIALFKALNTNNLPYRLQLFSTTLQILYKQDLTATLQVTDSSNTFLIFI